MNHQSQLDRVQTEEQNIETASRLDLSTPDADLRYDWSVEEVEALFAMPFMDLLFQAASVHRRYHNPNTVQLSQLMSIKTGGCAEDCAYCPQAARYAKDTGLQASKMMEVDRVLADAQRAKDGGASRYCMGAAWTSPKDRDMDQIIAMIKGVKNLGMEACVTLGMLTPQQAGQLKEAGLDYYNHNIDTSEDYYKEIITTRSFQDRLDTLGHVRDAGLNVCSGGIVGMGEQLVDRAGMLATLANLPEHPGSVPINQLVKVPGTPLDHVDDIDPFDFIRTIAVARILMPKSQVRLSAGREAMSDELQAMAFLAGANSIFYGDKLLTTSNPKENKDLQLLERLGMAPEGKVQNG